MNIGSGRLRPSGLRGPGSGWPPCTWGLAVCEESILARERTPLLFSSEGFRKGKWASPLRDRLREDLLGDWKATIRLWRGDWRQWIQYEPRNLPPGPRFYLAKPAILAFDAEALYAGLYVERGYDRGHATTEEERLGYVMDRHWHWHGLTALLRSPVGREQLFAGVQDLETPVVVLEKSRMLENVSLGLFPLTSPDVFAEVLLAANGVPGDWWVSLVVGIQIPAEVCRADPERVPGQCEVPLRKALDLQEMVEGSWDRQVSG